MYGMIIYTHVIVISYSTWYDNVLKKSRILRSAKCFEHCSLSMFSGENLKHAINMLASQNNWVQKELQQTHARTPMEA